MQYIGKLGLCKDLWQFNVNSPIKMVKNELLVYIKIFTETYSSELPLIGTKTIFRLLNI